MPGMEPRPESLQRPTSLMQDEAQGAREGFLPGPGHCASQALCPLTSGLVKRGERTPKAFSSFHVLAGGWGRKE